MDRKNEKMRRADIRVLKRAITKHQDKDAMARLLQRSVELGHKKLTLMRCIQAERMGLAIEPRILSYCQQVVGAMTEDEVNRIIRQATGASLQDRIP